MSVPPDTKLQPRNLPELGDRISAAIGVEPTMRGKIYRYIFESADAGHAFYWVSLMAACGIATLGLAQNSAAVVIGAMLLSPLMGPIVGVGYSLAIGDIYLGVKSALASLLSILVGVAASMALTMLLPFKEATQEILTRTRPNPLDMAIALLVGVIAAVSAARSQTKDMGTVLPGAAIAVSLVPPLCVAGWGLGAGPNWAIFRGGMLLFVTNLAAIIFTSMVFFLLIRAGAMEDIAEEKAFISEHEAGRGYYAWLARQSWANGLRKIGGVGNRILITAAAVLILILPLNSGLKQVKWEVLVSGTVRQGLKQYLGGHPILAQRLNVERRRVGLSLVLVQGKSPVQERIHQLEAYLNGRLAKPVTVDYTEVAEGRDIDSLSASGQGGMAPMSIATLIGRLGAEDYSNLWTLWPVSSGFKLVDIKLLLPTGEGAPGLLVTYLSDDTMPPAALETYQKAASDFLSLPDVRVAARRLPRTWGTVGLCARAAERQDAEFIAQVQRSAVPLPRNGSLRAALLLPPALSAFRTKQAKERASRILQRLASTSPGSDWPQEMSIESETSSKCPELQIRLVLS